MPAHPTTEMCISAFTGCRCAITFGDGWEVRFFDDKDQALQKEWEERVKGLEAHAEFPGIYRTEIELIKELGLWFRSRE